MGLAVSAIDQRELAVVGLVDALETAGNQLYRLADAGGEPEPGEQLSAPVPSQPMAAQ